MDATQTGGPVAAQDSVADDPDERPVPGEGPGLFGRISALFSGTSEISETGIPAEDAELRRGDRPGLGNLRHMRVEDVSIPRVEITAVPVDIGLADLVQVFRDSGNTRLPVYENTLDAPIGLIHLKDLALTHGFNGNGKDGFDLQPLLRPLLYAPPSMPIGVLLQKMQTDRSHMALVIDEYGGVDGLLTIEDLIEQVIGEIEDEHDVDEAALWTEEKPGCFIALARTPLAEFEAAVGMRLAPEEDDEEFDTLGGLLFTEIGRVPARGEVIAFASGVQFEVIDADPRRIKRLRVRMPGTAQPMATVKVAPPGAGTAA